MQGRIARVRVRIADTARRVVRRMAPTRKARSTSALRTWLVGTALWLALAGAAAIVLWHTRGDAVHGQGRELRLLSLALTDEIDRGLRGAEEGFGALREELRQGQLELRGPAAARALHTRADLMPLVGTLWLLDEQGRALAASDDTPLPDLRSFAPSMSALADGKIALSRPFADRLAQSQIALATRYEGPPGSAGGWIIAALPSRALLGAFAVAEPAEDERMSVFRDDGVRLAGSHPRNAPLIDEATVAARLAERPSLEERRFRDGTWHLVARNAVARYGLKVVVSRDLQAMLASWREAARLTAATLALLLLVMAVAVQVVLRANQRRADAQQALEAQLARAGKLEALGTLAGGVAHDFNNVLSGIVGFGEMARERAQPGSEQARHLDRLLQAAARGKALVGRILAFGRGGVRASTVFEPEPVIEEVLALLVASLRPGIVVERRLEAQGARVQGDSTHLFEAAMNLCTNALQAMPRGGVLSVELTCMSVRDARVLSHSQLQPGRYVALVVRDQGTGIDAVVMDRLFEPFFTTRRAQSGTGLGLAVVHGAVAEFGGAIDVRSVPGKGATFTLYLPASEAEAVDAATAPERASAGHGQRVPLVRDEPERMAR
jgi:signal transduction histidine kinase